ncbi:hypothetical protein AURDEDRAFT_162799 [Auricularia subglabra TFB-10046 SS5]|nr:hypothetical protein AURDEDRAFT_162799 [Auricularia subglabra TFB-10046 SS5]
MPHKRAKRSKREQERKEKATDEAPKTLRVDEEGVPKSMARILNAASVQQKYREDKKKREREDGGSEQRPAKRAKTEAKVQLKIQPGESIGHFNRRVEDNLRSEVQAARNTARKAPPEPKKKPAKGATGSEDESDEATNRSAGPAKPLKNSEPPKEFARAAPGRVRDVVEAPPNLSNDKFTKKVKAKLGDRATSKPTDVVSAAHQRMMELEREKAIARYRALKAAKASTHAPS